MKTLTKLPPYFDYLNELTLAELEAELESATVELQEATKEFKNASSYGGFPRQQAIAARKKSAATELIKTIKLVIKERE